MTVSTNIWFCEVDTMRVSRFAYYLLCEPSVLGTLRDETCSAFPEHITMRGRFLAPRTKVADLVAFGRHVFGALAPFTAELEGPRVFDSGLAWYEVPVGSPAYQPLRDIHRSLEDELGERDLMMSEVPAAFSGDGFVPHMTTSFGRGRDATLNLPARIRVTFVEWGLFLYDGPPYDPTPRCVFGEHLHATFGQRVSVQSAAWA